MDKLKKYMTIAAIAGAILITAVFCFMPFREALKERNKQIVSLEAETSAALEADKETVEAEDSTVQGQNQTAEQGKAITEIMLKAEADNMQVEIALWQSREGSCYFFLPGFAKEAKLQLSQLPEGTSAAIGTQKLREGDLLNSIKWEDEYEITLYDKEGEVLLAAPLIFMYSSDIPVLSLTTQSGSMEFIDTEKGNEEPGSIILLDEAGNLIYGGEAEKIIGRGNSTWGLSKKPYRFKLKEGADLFGFGKAKNWNLLADGYDETKLRNPIIQGLAEELGMSYVPKGKTVDVYCNGIYYGVYYLCEKVEVNEERVAIEDMEKNAIAAYTGAERESLERMVSEDDSRKWTATEIEEEDITGGYLIERELSARYEEEISGFITTQGDAYALQSPRYASENQLNYIADLMQEFQDAIEQDDGRNPKTKKHYTEYIDMTSFVQKYLVEEISKNFDGGATSSFFYKPADSVSKKIFAGPIWDYDISFGNCDLDEIVGNPIGITKLSDHIYGTRIFALLYEQKDFYERLVSMYSKKAQPYLDYLLREGIDALSEETKQAVKLDGIRWEDLANRYQYYEEYENEIRSLKYFIKTRKNFLNEVWLEEVIYHEVTFLIDELPWKKVYVKDGETIGKDLIPFRESSLFIGWFSEARNVAYDEYKPIYEDAVFNAAWQELGEVTLD